MRYSAAVVCAALLALAAGCTQGTSYPSAPSTRTVGAAGTFDYHEDYPAPDPYDPYPPPAAPAPPPPGGMTIAPAYGPPAGGTRVTIAGGPFTAEATAAFGAAPALDVIVVDAGTLTATTPPGAAGWIDVLVTNPGGAVFSLPGGYTYAAEAAPGAEPTLTIAPTGVSPKAIVVDAGTRVLVVNADARPHDIQSDPHPLHNDCPELNAAGFMAPGGSAHTGALMLPRTCGFHDHNDPGSAAWMGRIIIR